MKRWLIRRRMTRLVKKSHKTLGALNDAMKRDGLTRQERKRIWRDVYKGHTDTIDLLGGV